MNAQVLQALLESIASAQFTQHDLVGGPTHIFGPHDLVRVASLEHTVLVNARGMGECIGPHHRLVGLHHKARGLADHATRRHDVVGVDVQIQAEVILARLDRHDDFFQRAVACALTQPVDGALDLPRPTDLHAGKRIGHRHAQVVVAMHRPDRLVTVGNALTQGADEFAI